VGIPFQWEALDPGQRAALKNDPALLRWVRGSSSDSRANGGPYRDRITPLDAFTHSAPVLLPKEPPGNYPDSDHRTYRESRVLHAAEPVLFAADNGGLLHAFRAGPDGGEELFAYLPSSLMSRLFTLATKATGYLPILDGLLVVEDARLGDPDIANPWRTVLLGSLGRGGAGIYALDVTRAGDPGAEIPAGELLMWEIDSRFPRRTENGSPAYPHLGELHSPVSVIRTGDSQGDQGWFALIPNGLHSSSGATVLYLADLADGSLYQEIILSADGGGGLRSATAVDLDGNSTTDRVYAGDHHGRVWRLDWNADTRRFQSRYTAGGEPTPLFQAQVDGTGGAASKPIDGGFAISTLAGRAAEDATIVHFGTVAEHPLTNGLYAIWDSNDVPLTGADRLMQRQFRESEVAGTRVRTVEGEPFQYQEDGIRGWVVDLPLAGEFLAGTPSRFHDRLLFSTRTFSDPARTDPCEIRPSGWLMEVDALSGLEPGTAVLDLNGDGRIDDSDLASGRSVPGGVESGEESPVPPVFERMPGNTEPGLIRLEGGTGGSVTARALPLRLRRFAWRRRE
jgi:type IV pilus assembly protein PilY1